MRLPTDTKPLLWGAFAGAIGCAVLGFTWGGWVTDGNARSQATTAAQAAVVSALAPICAEQFRAQADSSTKVDALAKASSWERGTLVEKSGYAAMPGSKTTDPDVARACGELLAKPAPKS